ncbi:MAG: LacI family DNA-binding transcriptional regulator [Bacteroidota bacterium]
MGQDARVTIKDVAREAAVSISTVSKVLNHPEYGSAEVRQRVLDTVRRLDYQPHAIARSLVTRRSRTIGLILPDLSNPVFPIVARGVEHAVRKYGYGLILCNTDRDHQTERNYVRMFLEKRVDGIIFFAVLNRDDIQMIRSRNISTVVIERPLDVPDVDLIRVDNVDGGYLATRHLIGLGHARIGWVGGHEGVIENERLQGYRTALKEAGLGEDDRLIRACDYTVEDGKRVALDLLRLRNRPTAVFAACDIMAVGVLRAAEALGLSVPRDLALVGYDDTLGVYTSPPLTSVAQPLPDMAREAVRLLIQRLHHPERIAYQNVVFKPRLVVRQSCGAPRAG